MNVQVSSLTILIGLQLYTDPNELTLPQKTSELGTRYPNGSVCKWTRCSHSHWSHGEQVITVSGAQIAAQLTSQQLPKHRCLLPYETLWDTQNTHFELADMIQYLWEIYNTLE